MLPLFLGVFYLVVLQRRREQRIIAAALPHMAKARWIAPSEVELLASLPGRRAGRRQAKRQSGKRAAKAVAIYQASVTELAFLDRREIHSDADRQRQQELLSTLKAARAEATRLADEAGRG